MPKNILSGLLACLLILTGCGGSGGSTPPDDPAVRVSQTLVVDGRTRSYLLNLPPGYNNASAVPLVIALHGGGGNATQFENTALITQKADAAKFAVVYPNGTSAQLGLQTWNGGGCCGSAVTEQVDDVNFIRQLIQNLTTQYKIDPKRIYATGHSNGGIMSYRLACELSDRVAAIAPNAAALMMTTCTPARPVPVLHMHSTLDTNVPIAGGLGTGIAGVSFPALSTTLDRWVSINSCSNVPTQTAGNHVVRRVWPSCAAATSVQLLLTDDGGHAWPGGLPGSVMGDTPSTAISANDELWTFFQQHRLP